MTNTGLPETEPIHYLEQIPSTLDTGTDLTSQRRKPFLKV